MTLKQLQQTSLETADRAQRRAVLVEYQTVAHATYGPNRADWPAAVREHAGLLLNLAMREVSR